MQDVVEGEQQNVVQCLVKYSVRAAENVVFSEICGTP